MRTITLNDLHDPENPGDGWYIIEAAGDHPGITTLSGARVEFTQHLTPEVLAGIAAAGVPETGLLVDRDHESRNPDKPSEALGWARELAMCGDKLAARIEWSSLGLPLIAGRVYRFFSTVYPSAPEQMRAGSYSPTRLIGLALTNTPNNKAGQPAITNRAHDPLLPPTPGSETQTPTNTHMNPTPEVLAALGLAEGATPEEVQAAIVDMAARLRTAEEAAKVAEDAAAAAANSEAAALIAAEEEKTGTKLTEEEKEEVQEHVVANRAHGLRYLTALCNSRRARQAPARRYGDRSTPGASVLMNRRSAEHEAEVAVTNRSHEICRAAAAAGSPVNYHTARERARRELAAQQ